MKTEFPRKNNSVRTNEAFSGSVIKPQNAKSRLWLKVFVICGLLLSLSMQDLAQTTAFARSGSEGKGKQDKFSGQIFDRVGDGLGIWTVNIDGTTSRSVVVTAGTRLDDGILPIGAWVRVEGRFDGGGTLIASRVRRDYLVANQIVVRLQPNVQPNSIAATYGLVINSTLLASGGIYLFTLGNTTAEIEELTDQLLLDSHVVWAEPNFISGVPEGHPFKIWGWGGIDPGGYLNQQAYAQVNLPSPDGPYLGTGIDIAVLDTGIDLNHPAFAGRLVAGWDMVADDAIPQDEGNGLAWGHGTHVAGIIARVAPQSKIIPVRVLDTNGRGNTFLLAYAVEWAANHGAEVINLSLGSTSDSHLLRDVIKSVADQGVVVVVAAGNMNNNVAHFPAANPDVIGVTALDAQNSKALFANFGGGWVDVAAPGVGIYSTMVNIQGSGYATWSGTSMATPFVSGAAALMRQKYPAAATSDIQKLLTDNGRSIDSQNPLYQGSLGRLLDIQAALNAPFSINTSSPDVIPALARSGGIN